jgi:hypothetical protein
MEQHPELDRAEVKRGQSLVKHLLDKVPSLHEGKEPGRLAQGQHAS